MPTLLLCKRFVPLIKSQIFEEDTMAFLGLKQVTESLTPDPTVRLKRINLRKTFRISTCHVKSFSEVKFEMVINEIGQHNIDIFGTTGNKWKG